MSIEEIVARCSKFSGYDLQYKVEGRTLTIWADEPGAKLIVKNGVLEQDGYVGLKEIYGRMKHWNIDLMERIFIKSILY